MNCPKCGEAYSNKDAFCGNCGSFLNQVATGIESETSPEDGKQKPNAFHSVSGFRLTGILYSS